MNYIIESFKENLDFNSSKTLKESVYQAFRKSIILGFIPAGTRINENECAEVLNLSRTPIRYAMNQLINEDLVTRLPKIGIVVKGISIKDANEIYEIRKWLDTLATISAMEKMTAKDFEELKHLIDQAYYYDKLNKIDKVIQNFKEFNDFIYKKSDMKRLTAIVNQFTTYFKYFRNISLLSNHRRKEAMDEHSMIYIEMKNKNINQLSSIIHKHLQHSQKFVISEMEKNGIK